MKTAIVHDWLYVYAGAEKVLEELLNVYPEADIFTVIDFIPENERTFLKNKTTNTTFIQRLPFAKSKHRSYLPLMPLAIEQLDLSSYDLIISSSHAVAKGVLTGADQIHISYVHSPIRYAWDLQHQYLKEAGLTKGIKGIMARYLLHKVRMWDYRTANGVDYFVANSHFIGRRIRKVYGRDSTTIYPPVDVSAFELKKEKEEFYVTASRMVPYKRMDLIVEAFNAMPDKQLIVIGDGSDYEKIKKIAGENVTLMGYQPFEVMKDYIRRAKGFVFAAEEDFGIVPVEAQACGTPVIAYGKGGSLETVQENETGVFFKEQTPSSLIQAIHTFETRAFDPEACRNNALTFEPERFKDEIETFINDCMVSPRKVDENNE